MMTLLKLGFGAVAVFGGLMLLFLAVINAGHPIHFPFGWFLGGIAVCAVLATRGIRR